MKVRQDKIKIRHRAGTPDKVRIITGPVDLTLERAHEPHEITRSEWETVFSSATRAYFEVVENPVRVSDLSSPDEKQSKPSSPGRASLPDRSAGRRER